MPSLESLFNAFVTILVTIDPPGLAPLFLALTRGMNREERLQVSIRASVIGFGVLALFALAGAAILGAFGITLPAFRVAGGLLLFYIAAEMVFEKRNDRKEKSADTAITKDHIRDIAAFPLANSASAGVSVFCCTFGEEPSSTIDLKNSIALTAAASPYPDFLPSAEMTLPPAWRIAL